MEEKKAMVVSENEIGAYLKASQKSLSVYASKNYNQDSFFKSAMLAIVENNNLSDCLKTSQGKASLFNALRYAASTGLSLNPQEGKACLIAFGGKVQYQIMKNGLLTLAMESGKISLITADAVRENDQFELKKTIDGDEYTFIPSLRERGDFLGFFSAIKFKNGDKCVCWMTKEEVEKHRDSYSAMYKNKPDASPWKKSFEGMGIKTVLKKLIRSLTISDDIDRVVGTDDMFENVEIKNGYSADDVASLIEKKTTPVDREEVEPELPEVEQDDKKDKPLF